MKPRQDYGAAADGFFDALDAKTAPLARTMRELIRKALPKASESIKWGMPVYESGKLVCAIRPGRDYIALQFYASGTSLPDEDGLLEGTGQKMRHVKIRAKRDINKALFTTWIKLAAE